MPSVVELKPWTGIIIAKGLRGDNHCQYLGGFILFVWSVTKVIIV